MSDSYNLLARQPICNQKLKVIGFELLYRQQGYQSNEAIISDNDRATIDVLLSAFNDLDINEIVGNKLAFVNFTSSIIVDKLPPISPKQLVIELLENQEITPELLKSLSKLRKQGYKIALDDFCLNKETISLIEHANIIKLDVLEQEPASWEKYIPRLKEKGIRLLAEKVETYSVFEECCKLGFDLFQGYFFAKPKVIAGKRNTNNEITIVNLLSKVNSAEVNIDEVAKLIVADAKISYNLLRTINSGLFNLQNKVDSVKHAITMLGLAHLKKWINFIALSNLDNKPRLLSDTALLRAKFCEELGKVITRKNRADEYFTIGLFSLIDAFFDKPMEELVNKLSLSKPMRMALLENEGDMGIALLNATQYQSGKWEHQGNDAFTDEIMHNAYMNSLKWVAENHGNSE